MILFQSDLVNIHLQILRTLGEWKQECCYFHLRFSQHAR